MKKNMSYELTVVSLIYSVKKKEKKIFLKFLMYLLFFFFWGLKL